jgi:CelD/BcsL family acetyltransferase involved in cellulose biosynthesis
VNEPLDAQRYAELLASTPAATFFHTRTWAEILTRAFPQVRDQSRIVRRGSSSYALPYFRWVRLGGVLSTGHSSFPFLYGGPLPPEPQVWEAALMHLSRESGSLVVIGNPFAPEPQDAAWGTAAGLTSNSESTHLLTLPDSPDEFWNGVLSSRKRNDVRRLTRKGVGVELSRSDADIRAVYDLYRKRMRTWKQRPGLVYPLALYRTMLDLGGDAVRLYVVRFGGDVIGGTFVCRFGGISHYLAGYFDHDAARLRPNVLAQERIIRDAIEDHYRIYDMLPSAGIPAVEAFKESFGGVKTHFPRWEKRGRLHRLSEQIRSRFRDRSAEES